MRVNQHDPSAHFTLVNIALQRLRREFIVFVLLLTCCRALADFILNSGVLSQTIIRDGRLKIHHNFKHNDLKTKIDEKDFQFYSSNQPLPVNSIKYSSNPILMLFDRIDTKYSFLLPRKKMENIQLILAKNSDDMTILKLFILLCTSQINVISVRKQGYFNSVAILKNCRIKLNKRARNRHVVGFESMYHIILKFVGCLI